ncbi:MAG TPA: ParA family protein [Chloroflexia bacterium]|nr:ParA family protein [Chloroflexia bacterium]
MRKALREIEMEYGIPSTTLRAAIHRNILKAEKVGGIRMVDDESASFKEYLSNYRSQAKRDGLTAADGTEKGVARMAYTGETRNGITLGLCNQKGGVGKTSTVAALAAIYAGQGLRVLVVDNDPQGNVSLQLGVDALGQSDMRTVADLYLGKIQALEAAVSTSIEGLDLVPATVDLARVEMMLPTQQGSDLRLKSALKEAREQYDIILFDSPPNLGKLSINVLAASDWFLIPISGAWSVRSVDVILEKAEDNRRFYNTQSQFLGLVITMMERTKVMNSLREYNQENFAQYLLDTSIRRATLAREAEAMATPIPLYAEDSAIAEDYRNLAEEVATRIGLTVPA